MTTTQRTQNLQRIAQAAVAVERSHDVPAELTCGMTILESGWLDRCIGNNAWGIKAVKGQPFTRAMTTERLTPKQLAAEMAKGYAIGDVGALAKDGRMTVKIEQDFAAYPSLPHGFNAYADLLINGRHFKDRFKRYLEHKDIQRLLTDMSGADGKPPYFTGSGYIDLFNAIIGQSNVKQALVLARAEGYEVVAS